MEKKEKDAYADFGLAVVGDEIGDEGTRTGVDAAEDEHRGLWSDRHGGGRQRAKSI